MQSKGSAAVARYSSTSFFPIGKNDNQQSFLVIVCKFHGIEHLSLFIPRNHMVRRESNNLGWPGRVLSTPCFCRSLHRVLLLQRVSLGPGRNILTVSHCHYLGENIPVPFWESPLSPKYLFQQRWLTTVCSCSTDPSLFPGIKSKRDTRKQNKEITLFPKTHLLCPPKRAISAPFQYGKRPCVYLRRRLRKVLSKRREIKINCLFFVCLFPHIKPQKETSRD